MSETFIIKDTGKGQINDLDPNKVVPITPKVNNEVTDLQSASNATPTNTTLTVVTDNFKLNDPTLDYFIGTGGGYFTMNNNEWITIQSRGSSFKTDSKGLKIFASGAQLDMNPNGEDGPLFYAYSGGFKLESGNTGDFVLKSGNSLINMNQNEWFNVKSFGAEISMSEVGGTRFSNSGTELSMSSNSWFRVKSFGADIIFSQNGYELTSAFHTLKLNNTDGIYMKASGANLRLNNEEGIYMQKNSASIALDNNYNINFSNGYSALNLKNNNILLRGNYSQIKVDDTNPNNSIFQVVGNQHLLTINKDTVHLGQRLWVNNNEFIVSPPTVEGVEPYRFVVTPYLISINSNNGQGYTLPGRRGEAGETLVLNELGNAEWKRPGESYFTEETETGGTWIDGKPIYTITQLNSDPVPANIEARFPDEIIGEYTVYKYTKTTD